MLKGKERLVLFVGIYILILILVMMFLNTAKYQREIVIVTINNSKIEKVDFGFQTLTLSQGFFNPKAEGNLRFNYEVSDLDLNEVTYIGKLSDMGDGFFYITKFDFPMEDREWKGKFELKDENLNVLDRKCYNIKFEVSNGIRKVTEEEKICKI